MAKLVGLGSCGGGQRASKGGNSVRFRGLNPHRERGVIAKQRTINRDRLLLGMGVPLSIRGKVV